MDQRKNIKLYQEKDSTIDEIHQYHSKILYNHLNPPDIMPDTKETLVTSALITPNQIYEQNIKESLKNKQSQKNTAEID